MNIDRKALAKTILLLSLGWAAFPLIYILLKEKKKKEPEEKKNEET